MVVFREPSVFEDSQVCGGGGGGSSRTAEVVDTELETDIDLTDLFWDKRYTIFLFIILSFIKFYNKVSVRDFTIEPIILSISHFHRSIRFEYHWFLNKLGFWLFMCEQLS